MPSEQGVVSWPKKSKSVTALVDEVSWPVNTAAADVILISHGLEVSDNQDLLLQEVLRVLKDSGKLVILVPNRTGFGQGLIVHPLDMVSLIQYRN